MTKYHCIFRVKETDCWVSSLGSSSEEYARRYAEEFESTLVGLFATDTGICPPVGMRADEASHEWRLDLHSNLPFGRRKLALRAKTALEIQQEYHSDPDGDLDGYDGA